MPLAILLGLFLWGTKVFFTLSRPPAEAVEFLAVGRQWMWKFQHPQGTREINDLHVPVGQAIKFKMTSEDVIHSLFVPAFRVKTDVVPGRYTTVWFKATKPGTYHLFCAEYCGAEHSRMIGKVIVMQPNDYEAWLRRHADGAARADRGFRAGALRQLWPAPPAIATPPRAPARGSSWPPRAAHRVSPASMAASARCSAATPSSPTTNTSASRSSIRPRRSSAAISRSCPPTAARSPRKN